MMKSRGELSIETQPEASGGVRLLVVGDLDSSGAARLRAALAEHQGQGRDVILDLAGVQFIDSVGLRALVDAAQAPGGHGSVALVDDLPGHVRRVMAITGTLVMFRLIRR